ncbi:MAG: glutamate--tRNA ligase, partial [Pseudohongiella sp.]|nr:glutamate--tRNA ligase [Pseudohongiella sp.]
PAQCKTILQLTVWQLEQLPEWSRESVELLCQTLSQFMGIKIRETLFPLFIAITGKAVSTSVIDAIYILGLDISRARIRHALDVLGGVSKKEVKELEKTLRDLQKFLLPAQD